MDQQFKLELESKFQQFDPQGTGMIKKSDFINVIFESVRGSIQASELISFMNLFTTSFDEILSYDDFLKLLYKFSTSGDIMQSQPS